MGKARVAAPTPNEDLMREHGVLRRLLLVYEDGARRIESGQELPLDAIARAAVIIRTFIEDQHQRLEEQWVFPRLEKAGQHVELVQTLRQQHAAMRKVTDTILQMTAQGETADRAALAVALRAYLRAYRPHAAREDTVVFPSLREMVSAREYKALQKTFAEQERLAARARRGFASPIVDAASIEKILGIHDLAQFTPQ